MPQNVQKRSQRTVFFAPSFHFSRAFNVSIVCKVSSSAKSMWHWADWVIDSIIALYAELAELSKSKRIRTASLTTRRWVDVLLLHGILIPGLRGVSPKGNNRREPQLLLCCFSGQALQFGSIFSFKKCSRRIEFSDLDSDMSSWLRDDWRKTNVTNQLQICIVRSYNAFDLIL